MPPRVPFAGFGLGLRRPHWDTIFDHHPGVDFFELLVDNYIDRGGRIQTILDRAAETLPIVLHGVGLSIGGPEPLNPAYLDAVKAVARRTRALWWTDHICWSNAFGVEYHDLIPLPLTREAADRVITRVRQVQDTLGLPFGLENASYYMQYAESEMPEAEFITRIIEGADCGLLLDVNNVYVNSQNHGFDPRAFIDALPLDHVIQLHLAGHELDGDVIIDTHGASIRPEVLDLYAYTLSKTGPVTTLIERDTNIPPLDILLAENDAMRACAQRVLGEALPCRP